MEELDYRYKGSELDLFKEATNWKSYLFSVLRPYIGKDVLEVGSGIGANIGIFCSGSVRSWLCLEPDKSMCAHLDSLIKRGMLPGCCSIQNGSVKDIACDSYFDTILYIDVLEHIADDRAELAQAVKHLKRGGHLLVASPAHNWLFSDFDRQIGHYRRYTRKLLAEIVPEGLKPVKVLYLDCIGLFASGANKFFLKRKMPGRAQLAFWDKAMVPLSRCIDPVCFFLLGKSVVGLWRNDR